MEIYLINHMVYANYENYQVDYSVVNQILDNTAETWQPDRSVDEKDRNTKQGKIAEAIVEKFLNIYFSQSISMKSYDEIRNDGYLKHAPFDFLIWKTGEADISQIVEAVRNDISSTMDKYVHLSQHTRQLCKEMNVKIVEVKSTKIRDSLKKEADFEDNYNNADAVRRLANTIKDTDDVFCYPYFKRSEARKNYSFEDYCNYVKSLVPSLRSYEGEELRKKVIDLEVEKQSSDVFIRVYLDTLIKKGFVIGWIQRERLLDYDVLFKRMYQPNKSEKALYFTKSLRETDSLENLIRVFEKADFKSIRETDSVYANPYTITKFYHKSRNCNFLKRVKEEDIIVYRSEEEAIESGRYIQRCKNCF